MSTAKWKLWTTIALAALLPLCACAVEPRLAANGNEVRSFEPPAVVSVPEEAKYLGSRRWLLHGYADCDLHLFADHDADGVVTRLYWVQSEGYIDSRPELSHAGDYDKSRKLGLGGLDFHLDTWIRHADDKAPAQSDLEQVEQLIARNGLKLPADMAFVRLVHLPDPAQRKELMLIYAQRADTSDSPAQQEQALANAKARMGVRRK